MHTSSLRSGTDVASGNGIDFAILTDAGELITSWQCTITGPLVRCAGFKKAAGARKSMTMKQVTVLHRSGIGGCVARADYDLDIASAEDRKVILKSVSGIGATASVRAIIALRSRV
jgi:hypothetical protein